MEEIQQLKSLIDKAVWQASLYYVGIFYRDTELISATSSRSKNISYSFGILIERSLELNDILPNFREEFLFSEGKDYSLFVYYMNENISIGMIHIGKPNFSLLKVTAVDLAKGLQPFLPFLSDLYTQKITDRSRLDVEKTEKSTQSNLNVDANLEELLEFGSQTNLTKEEEISPEDLEIQRLFEENIDDFKDDSNFEAPSLEEIFQQDLVEDLTEVQDESKETLDNIQDIMDKISVEFVKEIGPFGKFLFKKKREEFFTGKSVTKVDLLKFVNLLSEEIKVQHRKEEFLEKAKSHIINL